MSTKHEVKRYIVETFAPDVPADELEDDYDLLDNGVIDSLGLLRLIAWLGERYSIPVEDLDIQPGDFRSVTAICSFIDSSPRLAAA